jgi:hypothetical protein
MERGFPITNICLVAPTSAKAFARDFLPEEERTTLNAKGKPVKVKMDKPMMIKAVEQVDSDLLKGVTLTDGKADLADAYMIGLKFIHDF